MRNNSGKIFGVLQSGRLLDVTERTLVGCYRADACWMRVATGGNIGDIPSETQFLLTYNEGEYTLYFALTDGAAINSIFMRDKTLCVLSETGDGAASIGKSVALYRITGDNPYKLTANAYDEIKECLSGVRLGTSK